MKLRQQAPPGQFPPFLGREMVRLTAAWLGNLNRPPDPVVSISQFSHRTVKPLLSHRQGGPFSVERRFASYFAEFSRGFFRLFGDSMVFFPSTGPLRSRFFPVRVVSTLRSPRFWFFFRGSPNAATRAHLFKVSAMTSRRLFSFSFSGELEGLARVSFPKCRPPESRS